jgi:hypothetical protein
MQAIRLPLGIALIVGGLLADSVVLQVFGLLFTLSGPWSLSNGFRVRRALRETISRDHMNRLE